MPKLLPMPVVGDRFGRLTVTGRAPDSQTKRGGRLVLFHVVCDCGTEKVVPSDSIRSGRSNSCGCLCVERVKEASITHGMRQSSEYAIWNMMRQRCQVPTSKFFKNYGGRGIKVCDRWQKFENFLEDMGKRPFEGASIDRVDNDGDYCPGNCRWATRTEQGRNKRNTRRFEFQGQSLTLPEWAEKLGIKQRTLSSRLYAYGWSVEMAFTTPVMTQSESAQLAGHSPYRHAGNDVFDVKEAA